MDIDVLALSDEAFDLRITHPVSGEPLGTDENPVTISVYGSASDQYRDAVASLQLKSIRRGTKKPTPAETKADTVSLIVACTKGSKNLRYKGKDVVSASDFSALYSDPKFSWILEQVAGALNDPSNFLSQ